VKAPAFWHEPRGALALALAPFGWLYGRITAARMTRPGQAVDLPVICIGNLTAGGTGKTPVALWLADELKRRGERPVFLTRGYGGSMKRPCLVRAGQHHPSDVGDEALLLAQVAPTIVSADRRAALPLLKDLSATLLIMDDGLQNPSIAKDLAIALIDGQTGFGNGLCIPAGPLRAPVASQLHAIDLAVLMGAGEAGETAARRLRDAGIPVASADLVLEEKAVAELRGRPVLAFAGIGRPTKFFDALRQAGLDVRAHRDFPDHHPYRADDLTRLRQQAQAGGLQLVTTSKDRIKLPADATDVAVVEASVRPTDAQILTAVEKAIARRRSGP
jgi:tetraacyldisaccharide 4'-kinase